MDTRTMAIAALCLAAAASMAAAQEPAARNRGQEFSIVLPHLDSKSTTFDGGTVVDTESSTGLGFGFDYRFADRWTAGASMTFHELDYVANIAVDGPGNTAPGDVVDAELEATSIVGHAKRYFGDWPRVAPYASAGLGFVSIDTNIPEGPPVGYCWWHPWWGYVCENVQPTSSSTDMTASVGFGVRWDLTRRLFFDASVARQWIDFDNAHRPDFSQLRLAIGFR